MFELKKNKKKKKKTEFWNLANVFPDNFAKCILNDVGWNGNWNPCSRQDIDEIGKKYARKKNEFDLKRKGHPKIRSLFTHTHICAHNDRKIGDDILVFESALADLFD